MSHKCLVHPHIKLTCPACAGSKGGKSKSKAKARAARKNGNKQHVASQPSTASNA